MSAITAGELDIILDSTHDAMIAVDRSSIVTLFNRAAERITGLRSEAVIGRHPAREVIPNTRLHIVLSEGKPEINQEQRLKDVVILTNRVPIRDEEGAIIGAVAVFRDVTEISALTDKVTGLWNALNLEKSIWTQIRSDKRG
jgi:PAS domain S-box-containing protein